MTIEVNGDYVKINNNLEGEQYLKAFQGVAAGIYKTALRELADNENNEKILDTVEEILYDYIKSARDIVVNGG